MIFRMLCKVLRNSLETYSVSDKNLEGKKYFCLYCGEDLGIYYRRSHFELLLIHMKLIYFIFFLKNRAVIQLTFK